MVHVKIYLCVYLFLFLINVYIFCVVTSDVQHSDTVYIYINRFFQIFFALGLSLFYILGPC